MTRPAPGWATAALLLYAATSWALFAHGASLRDNILGLPPDPYLIIWCLRYLPWAIAHHQFAPVTHLLWQPNGLNLAWVTTVPLLGFIIAPVTLAFGPVLSFNLLTLAAPALAGWAAYFLCLELCELPLAALLGGFLFAFSSYEAAQTLGHLNLDFTVLLPLILLVALRRVRGRAGRGRTVLWLGLLLGGEFLISEEVLATTCLFGAACFLLAYAFEAPRRPALRALALDILLAAPLALALASPVLWAMATGPQDVAHPAFWAEYYATDALNFLLPTVAEWGGQSVAPIARHFTAGQDEQAGYLGLPLLMLLGMILCDTRLRRTLWLPLTMLGLAMLASMGTVLHVRGYVTGIPLPWALIAHLPLIGAALPARIMVYGFLSLAVIVSLWLRARPGVLPVLAVACICLSLMPVPHPARPAPVSAFFQPGRVQQILGPRPVLLILPFSKDGASAFWQAENEFGFDQAGGYLGYPPAGAQDDPAVHQLWWNKLTPSFPEDFTRFAQRSGAGYVVVGPGTPADQLAALASLQWSAQKIDDVTIYTIPRAP